MPIDLEDLEHKVKLYMPAPWAADALALIRRVERYEKALKTSAQCGLCPFCASTARVALKEESDSVG